LGHASILWRFAGKRGALRAAWDSLSVEEKNAAILEAARGKLAILPATVRGRNAWNPDRIVPTQNGFVPIRMRPLADAS